VPGAVGYISPALSADASLQFRLSPTLAIAVGVSFWADNASIVGNNASPPAPKESKIIPTPGYNLATGSQVFIGPFLGMQFGP
jgi:hypothetical protein